MTMPEETTPAAGAPVEEPMPAAPTVAVPAVPAAHWPSQAAPARPAGALEQALEAARTGDPGALARYLVLRRPPVKSGG